MRAPNRSLKTAVVYHGNCLDGFTSAYVAAKYFNAADFFKEEYHNRLTINQWKLRGYTQVVYVDFSPEESELLKEANDCYVIDHHPKVLEMLTKAHPSWGIFFDEDLCGATATYTALFGKNDYTNLLKYVQDYDLYKFDLPLSRPINAFLLNQNRRFSVFAGLEKGLEDKSSFKLMAAMGEEILRSEDVLIKQIFELSSFEEDGIMFVNSAVLVNRIADFNGGDKLACIYNIRKDGLIKCSFRGPGARAAAESLGGSGHEQSAGAVIEELPWLVLQQLVSSQPTDGLA